MRGADVILVPTALGHQWGWVAHQMIPTRGFENGALMVRAGAAPDIIAAPIEKSRVQAAQARLPYHQDVAKIQLDDITEAPAGDG